MLLMRVHLIHINNNVILIHHLTTPTPKVINRVIYPGNKIRLSFCQVNSVVTKGKDHKNTNGVERVQTCMIS